MTKKLFEKFQGRKSTGTKKIELQDMKNLTYLGEIVAIEYYTHKPHLDKKPEIYRHDFDKKCDLLTNGKELIIYGKSIKIKEDGIHG